MSVIRGTTIATPISRSAVADDTAVSKRPWSSKNTVDKLCPSFTESGSVVACEPVEGYPLEVAWKTKNLIDPNVYIKEADTTTLDGDVFTTNFTSGGQFVNRYGAAKGVHPAGTYTVSVIPVTENCCLSVMVYNHDTGKEIARIVNTGSQSGYSMTFTASAPFRVTVCGPSDTTKYGTYSYKLQLEEGTTATAYEPYAETATITRCGKNLFGGNALRDAIVSKDLGGGVTVDADNKTLTFYPRDVERDAGLFDKFKANTQYTVILYGYNDWEGGVSNLRVRYTDGTYKTVSFNNGVDGQNCATYEAGYAIYKTDTAKVIRDFCFLYWTGNTTLYYDKCGIFEGDVSLEEFEAYMGETFSLGEPITALPGVNTIYADAGLVTVTGKADPTAIINKLCDKVEAMSATITALTGV